MERRYEALWHQIGAKKRPENRAVKDALLSKFLGPSQRRIDGQGYPAGDWSVIWCRPPIAPTVRAWK
ncbi:hypothetical protein SLE2022_109720 [Rubroshorea leprosula]